MVGSSCAWLKPSGCVKAAGSSAMLQDYKVSRLHRPNGAWNACPLVKVAQAHWCRAHRPNGAWNVCPLVKVAQAHLCRAHRPNGTWDVGPLVKAA